MALVEQLAQHPWLLLPGVVWIAPSIGQRWLAFLRDLRAYRAGE